ncbi:LytR/AlgR family response regulator transcription factor [Deminuibacter soli]|uniref:DNA-binding response regulator n=1 Tax=Deminuibacter soli TaxID=2291815 RepID=A0A3E1NKF5_9BACT|nr:LytTR family DNA-binding domain-containing protein [Deminuibacter soli]RFM28314.1 DNA-binding response regulator [Deminuibacter soli]
MIIHCVIIDDEPLARKGLREYIADIDFLHLSAEYDSPLKLQQQPEAEQPQLLFLDIQMPKITGTDFLRTLQQPPPVIITTAYPQYALEGFELNVLDYLVKPISFSRFVKAAMKAKEYYTNRLATTPAAEEQGDHLFIKADNRIVKIRYADILFIEALQNYVCIYTGDQKHITYLTFKSMEENLPADRFLKVHKSFLVNLGRIDHIENNELHLGRHTIPISRTNREEILQKILGGKYLKR